GSSAGNQRGRQSERSGGGGSRLIETSRFDFVKQTRQIVGIKQPGQLVDARRPGEGDTTDASAEKQRSDPGQLLVVKSRSISGYRINPRACVGELRGERIGSDVGRRSQEVESGDRFPTAGIGFDFAEDPGAGESAQRHVDMNVTFNELLSRVLADGEDPQLVHGRGLPERLETAEKILRGSFVLQNQPVITE